MSAVFERVWFRDRESSWSRFELLAMQDTGTLEVHDGWLRFVSRKRDLEIREVLEVTMRTQGRDFMNSWVTVSYVDRGAVRTVFFNDGSRLGWGGLLGGTRRLHDAVVSGLRLVSIPPAWHPDPFERHQWRYWDGASWTADVSDDGVVATDPDVLRTGTAADR